MTRGRGPSTRRGTGLRWVALALLLEACAPAPARMDGGPRDAAPPDAGAVPSCAARCPAGFWAVCASVGRAVSWRCETGAGWTCFPAAVTDLRCDEDAGPICGAGMEPRCAEIPEPDACGC